MNTIHIYSTMNWLMVKYLWPNGDWINGQYCVFLDVDSPVYASNMRLLAKHSPATYTHINSSASMGCAVFTIHCARG